MSLLVSLPGISSRRTFALRGSLTTIGLLLGALTAHAQTAGQITQKSYAPSMIAPQDKGFLLPEFGGNTAPKGADKLHVTLSGLDVEGGLPALAEATARVEADLKNRRVSAADLFEAARELEAAYAKAGYLLVRVTLPPQAIQNGHRLKLVVTKGYVEAVDSSALPERVRPRVARLLSSLVGRDTITRTELERQLLLAGDTPGLMLKSVLKPGKAPGSTVIVVEGRHDLVSASVSVDNSQSVEMGRWTSNLGLNVNDLFGFGEVIYTYLAGYPGTSHGAFYEDDPRNRQMILGFTAPLGTGGYWLGMEAVDSRTHAPSATLVTIPDHFQRFSTRLGYHWLRGRNANLSSVLSFDAVEETQKIDFGGVHSDFTKDSLRVARLTQSGNLFPSWGGSLSGQATLSVGIDGLGARQATNALPLSRSKARPDFVKLSMQARFDHAFANGLASASLSTQAQTSFGEALVSSEQMTLGGLGWLSAFDNGKFAGDSAVMARAELTLPKALPFFGSETGIGAAVAPYLYAAGGISTLAAPTAVEREITRAASFGAGLRFGLSQKGSRHAAELDLEVAHGIATGVKDENRFNISLHCNF